MFDMKLPFVLVLGLGLAGMAVAQTSTEPAPTEPAPATGTETPPADPAVIQGDAPAATSDGLSLGKPATADGIGSTYTQETFVDWQLRCVRTADGNDPCQLYQLLKDNSGNAVAEISLFVLPEGQQAVAGATIVTPLETLLTEDITLKVDAGAAKRYPFTWCSAIGCIARVGFTAPDVAALKAGSKATITIVPVAAPDQKVELNVSLNGFTLGYEAVSKFIPK